MPGFPKRSSWNSLRTTLDEWAGCETMTTEDDTVRFLCLLDELDTSRELLKSGFGHLQEYPDQAAMKSLGHDLESLLESVCTEHLAESSDPWCDRIEYLADVTRASS